MKRRIAFLGVGLAIFALLALVFAPAPPVYAGAGGVVISQVYGGGGGGSGYYIHDYVELFNSGSTAASLDGWSLQYGSAAGNFGSSATNILAFPAGTTIQPGRYLLVSLSAAGTAGIALPNPDFSTTNLSMAAASGKVALANIATTLGCGTAPCVLPHANIVDLASWGAANNAEGGASINNGVALTAQQGGVRKLNGCQDTDNNNADFSVVAGANLNPRNSASPAFQCGVHLQKTAPASVNPGSVFTYTLTALNATSPAAAVSEVVITDVLPAGVSYVPGSASDGGVLEGGSTISWTLASLPFGQTLIRTFQVTAPAQAGLITNSDYALAAAGQTTLSGAPVSTTIGTPNLVINKTGDANGIAGSRVAFTITYASTGDVAAENVRLVDTLPAGMTFADASGNPLHSGSLVTWTLGSVAPGVTGTLTLGGIPAFSGANVNTVVAASSNAAGAASAWSVAVAGADPYVDKNGPAVAQSGQTITYTLAYGNHGTAEAANVSLVDQLPVGVVYVGYTSSSPVTFAQNGQTLDFALGTLEPAPAGTGVITITAQLPASFSTPIINTATITTTSAGDRPGDDSDSVITSAPPGGSCGDAFTHTYDVQGTGGSSPMFNQTVSVEGTVTGVFQGSSKLGGFFIQDPASGPAGASTGLFIYNSATTVSVGQRVRAHGKVTEYGTASNTLTELGSIDSVLVCGAGATITPAAVSFPVTAVSDLERYEGMLVSVPQTMTVTDNYTLGRYGQLTLSSDGRVYNPTNGQGGDAATIARRTIVLDDGSNVQNPAVIPYMDANGTRRVGDTVAGLTGILTTDFAVYRIDPTADPAFVNSNPRTTEVADPGGALRVAAFNVNNYFITLNPPGRGAKTTEELDRQRGKIVPAILGLDADVLGVVEVENIAGNAALHDLADHVNAALGANTYAVLTDTIPVYPASDQIKVGILYKPARVTPIGTAIVDTNPIWERPPLAQTFTANGRIFTLIVNHFKSKSSCPTAGTDLENQDNGQGCWNAKRVLQAQELLAFINTLGGTVGGTLQQSNVLVMGDLNSYGEEDPIHTLTTGGLINEIKTRRPLEDRYSYGYSGTSGYLDQALASPNLDTQIAGVSIWHINGDEPAYLDYTVASYKQANTYFADPYRSSDHDPVVVGLARWFYYLPVVNKH
jgi:uncharacterized protein